MSVVLSSTMHIHAYIVGKMDHNLSTWLKFPVAQETMKVSNATAWQVKNAMRYGLLPFGSSKSKSS